jgi:hypothetical protein
MSRVQLNAQRAFRSLRRAPGFTITAVLTLALGIGTSVALFTAVRAVFLKPLPYPHADRLVAVARSNTEGRGYFPLSGPQFFELQAEAKTL